VPSACSSLKVNIRPLLSGAGRLIQSKPPALAHLPD
jgi:hypothetical protein